MSRGGTPGKEIVVSKKEGLTATHHALLFAWIARELVQRVGEKTGQSAVVKWVRRYGEERGRRMALRASASGDPLTVANYFVYGEWEAGEGEMEQGFTETSPHAKVLISKCPWFGAWEANGLVSFGRLYCQEIDGALLKGFNPALRIDVHGTLSNGATACEFVFLDARLTATRFSKKAVMAWSYHLGHLYRTACEVLTESCGKAGQQAVDAAMEAFAGRFGTEALNLVLSHRDTDFTRLP